MARHIGSIVVLLFLLTVVGTYYAAHLGITEKGAEIGAQNISEYTMRSPNEHYLRAETIGRLLDVWKQRKGTVFPVLLLLCATVTIYIELRRFMQYQLRWQRFSVPRVLMISRYIEKIDGRKRIVCNS